tara:strand:+ start:10575 stop:10739 length:165 start_codon:yes stop_codon:yes gene_type:complete
LLAYFGIVGIEARFFFGRLFVSEKVFPFRELLNKCFKKPLKFLFVTPISIIVFT